MERDKKRKSENEKDRFWLLSTQSNFEKDFFARRLFATIFGQTRDRPLQFLRIAKKDSALNERRAALGSSPFSCPRTLGYKYTYVSYFWKQKGSTHITLHVKQFGSRSFDH